MPTTPVRSRPPDRDRSALLARLPPQRLAVLILGVLIAGYGGLALVGVVFGARDIVTGVVSTAVVLVLLVLQLGYLGRPDRAPRAPAKYAALLLQAVLVLGPIALFGPDWHGFPGILAGSALLVLSPVLGALVFVLVVVVVVLISSTAYSPQTADLDHVVALTYVVTSTVTAGVAVFGLTTLVRSTVEAHRTRDELRATAVAAERARFTERLRASVGEALSSIALRGELVIRLLATRTGHANAELQALLARARAALTEAQALVRAHHRADPSPGERPGGVAVFQLPAPRVAQALLLVVLLDFAVLATVGVLAEAGPVGAGITAAVRIAEVVLVVVLTQRAARMSAPVRAWCLVALAVLVFGPVWWLGPQSHGAEGWLIGTALAVLPLRRALLVAVPVWLGTLVVEYADPSPSPSLAYSLAYLGVGTVVSATIVWGLGTAARLLGEVGEARHRLSELAVASERERLARDAHDLMGLSLTTVTVKCELVSRLLDSDPERARLEFAEAMTAAREALVDLQRVSVGAGLRSLASECRVVDSALRTADIRVRLEVEGTAGDGAVLVAVLREGVTNVLRHSTATWCSITVRADAAATSLEIVNDGVVPRSGCADSGSGVPNMLTRVRAVGGTLDAGADGDVYRLHAVVPRTGTTHSVAAGTPLADDRTRTG